MYTGLGAVIALQIYIQLFFFGRDNLYINGSDGLYCFSSEFFFSVTTTTHEPLHAADDILHEHAPWQLHEIRRIPRS